MPKKKKGISTANAAAAIAMSGVQVRRPRGALNVPIGEGGLWPCPDFAVDASFAPTASARRRLNVGIHVRTRSRILHGMARAFGGSNRKPRRPVVQLPVDRCFI